MKWFCVKVNLFDIYIVEMFLVDDKILSFVDIF